MLQPHKSMNKNNSTYAKLCFQRLYPFTLMSVCLYVLVIVIDSKKLMKVNFTRKIGKHEL